MSKEGKAFDAPENKLNTDRSLTREELENEVTELAESLSKLMKLVREGVLVEELKWNEETNEIVGRVIKNPKNGEVLFWEDERLIEALIKEEERNYHGEN